MKILRPGLFSLLPFLGLACALPPARPPAAELEARWAAHAAALAPLSQWQIRGRLAVRTDERGGQATLSWERDGTRHAIRLNGPFGAGGVRITQDADGARLVDAEARSYQADTAAELIELYTGWQLPVAQLEWWLRGLPAPGADAGRGLDEAGRLRHLRQDGWEVRYEGYQRVETIDLPARLALIRPADADHPAMEARLVIDRWGQVR